MSVGAHSAALAMFRAALEQVLLDQGFKARMLGPKVTELEAAIAKDAAPKWARDLDTEYLTILKDLGNGAIHPAHGQSQAAFDAELVRKVQATMGALLYDVYEVDRVKQAHRGRLRSAVALVKK